MKHLLKWVIPTVVLLMIGMWVGLNWDNFPANEVPYVTVEKKYEAKYDTAVNSSVEDTTLTASVNDEPVSSTAIDSLYVLEDEQLNHDSKDEQLNDDNMIPEDEDISKTTPEVTAIASKRQPVVSRFRNVTPENGARSNQNHTYSVAKVIQPKPVDKPAPAETVAPKKEIVYDSYMSRKEIPVDNLVKVDGTYKPGASGKGVSEATFIVHNVTGKNLKKVNMEVQYLDKNNLLLNKVEMPVNNISADGSVNLKLPANAEANRLVYKVLYVSSALGDFYYEPLRSYASALK